jgi:hypothetical protein
VEERFWAKVQKTETCWLWTGAISKYGYGRWSIRIQKNKNKHYQAHRFAYELLVGPIPEGLPLDHVKANGCTSRACVKAIGDEYGPAHLEPVTMRENILRGTGRSAQQAKQTHCVNGHPFDEANTHYRPGNGARRCRVCNRDRQRRRQAQP